jgi:hypothetical protein
MKWFAWSCLVLFLALPSLAGAQGRFFTGATGGLGLTSLSGDAPENASYTGRAGFSAGAIGEFALTDDIRLSLQPSYSRKGTGVAFDLGTDDLRDSLMLTMDYFSLPLMARFISPGKAWFVNGGFDLGFLLKALLEDVNAKRVADVKDAINTVDLAMLLGVGMMFPVESVSLTVEVRYSQSILNAGTSSIDAVFGMPTRFRLSGFQFLAGILVPL